MYCILDCILPINLMRKLDVIQKNVAMANLCKVPMNFLFTRGQGSKLFSLVLVGAKCKLVIAPVSVLFTSSGNGEYMS